MKYVLNLCSLGLKSIDFIIIIIAAKFFISHYDIFGRWSRDISTIILIIAMFPMTKLTFLLWLVLSCKYEMQSIVSERDGRILYCEVLSRFMFGLSPVTVIEYLRTDGLLLLHTLLQIYRVSKVKDSLQYGVNVCPSLLIGVRFYFVLYMLRKSHNIGVVEITENSGVAFEHRIIGNILRIKQENLAVALDDFGTGNNNIVLLEKFNPDFVKLDKSFVKSVTSSDFRIMQSIRNICIERSCLVIIEGIENERQYEVYKGGEETFYQGFYFSISSR